MPGLKGVILLKKDLKIRYRCLVLDHDDTIVKSTPDIHYPSFLDSLKKLRPEINPFSYEEYISYCFEPGFFELCKDIMNYTKNEQEYQYNIWKAYTKNRVPDFYPGLDKFFKEYIASKGIICVVSHSDRELIRRDYDLHFGFIPELIFGWDIGEDLRKPNPYSVMEIMKKYDLDNDEVLVLDDLKPGLDMARNSNVDFACAGWSHVVPRIESYMKENSDFYFKYVKDFADFIFSV